MALSCQNRNSVLVDSKQVSNRRITHIACKIHTTDSDNSDFFLILSKFTKNEQSNTKRNRFRY